MLGFCRGRRCGMPYGSKTPLPLCNNECSQCDAAKLIECFPKPDTDLYHYTLRTVRKAISNLLLGFHEAYLVLITYNRRALISFKQRRDSKAQVLVRYEEPSSL